MADYTIETTTPNFVLDLNFNQGRCSFSLRNTKESPLLAKHLFVLTSDGVSELHDATVSKKFPSWDDIDEAQSNLDNIKNMMMLLNPY